MLASRLPSGSSRATGGVLLVRTWRAPQHAGSVPDSQGSISAIGLQAKPDGKPSSAARNTTHESLKTSDAYLDPRSSVRARHEEAQP